MTSSIRELSDKGESHEQQEQSDPQIQPTTPSRAIKVPQCGVTNPTVQYPLTPQPGTAHAMTPGAYPYPDPYYRSIFAPYENQPYPPQSYPGLMGIQSPGVPLPSDAVEEPVFVNAKQYHGILRRRQSRAKLESQNRVVKSRKPYMHESRHLHALRRPRGCGGRFLNLKKHDSQQNDMKTGDRASEGI